MDSETQHGPVDTFVALNTAPGIQYVIVELETFLTCDLLFTIGTPVTRC